MEPLERVRTIVNGVKVGLWLIPNKIMYLVRPKLDRYSSKNLCRITLKETQE